MVKAPADDISDSRSTAAGLIELLFDEESRRVVTNMSVSHPH